MNWKLIIYNRKNRISIQKILFITVLLVSLIYTVIMIMAPARSLARLEEELRTLNPDNRIPDTQSKQIDSLINEKAYYEARLKMAKIDSIGISISLIDSTINLEIKGIDIHSTHIERIKTDKFFNKLTNSSYYQLFSKPLIAQSHFSYIKKEPIKIVDAPTDTTVEKQEVKIDSLNAEKTLVIYSLDSITKIILLPSNSEGRDAWANEKAFLTAISSMKLVSNLEKLSKFEIPKYIPVTILYIPYEDILTFHRALPEKGKVCIQY